MSDSGGIWRGIPGWESLYEVSSLGRVRSLDRVVFRPQNNGPSTIRGRLLSQGSSRGWYPLVSLRNGKNIETRYVHRIVADVFLGAVDGKTHVNHKDGNKQNNAVENLEWCTHKENMIHAAVSGLMPPSNVGPGEKSPAAKLSEAQVKEIKSRLAGGEPVKKIARDFPVSASAISEIKAGRSWAHVGRDG